VFLLVCAAASLHFITRMGLLISVGSTFALYGALHACALTLALRERQSIGRSVSFIAAAAGLSVLTLQIGLVGMRRLGALPGNRGLYVVLGVSAVVSAASYGMLIRLFSLQELTGRCIALISVVCVMATYAAFFSLAQIHWFGRGLLAVFWWCAFSGGLWLCGRERSRVVGPAHAA
jgi:hypothetical protein